MHPVNAVTSREKMERSGDDVCGRKAGVERGSGRGRAAAEVSHLKLTGYGCLPPEIVVSDFTVFLSVFNYVYLRTMIY